MNTTKILALRKPLLISAWLLAMQGAAFAQNPIKRFKKMINIEFDKRVPFLALLLSFCVVSFAQNLRETFFSPNGKIEWKAEGEENKVKVFEVAYRDACKGNKESQVLHITGYGLNTSDGGGRNLVLKGISKPKYISEHYQMLMGKKSECKNEANEIVYTFGDDLQRPLRMVVRLYNDGVAFRYECISSH